MHLLLHLLLRVILRLFFGFVVRNKIEERQCIVIANHNTHLDIFALFCLFPLSKVGQTRAVAARDYFGEGVLGKIACYLFNAVLMERGRKGGSEHPLEPISRALRSGNSVIIFPEGTRGSPGVMEHFKSGIGELVIEFPELPIYPVSLLGIEKALPRGQFVMVPFSIEARSTPRVLGKELVEKYGEHGRKEISADLEARVRSGLIKEG